MGKYQTYKKHEITSSVCRVNKDKNYTVMSNYHLQSDNLSLKATGLLSKILSLPDNWDYTIAGLVYICKEKETAIKSALKELKEWGYLVVEKKMPNETKSGRIEYIYNFYEYSEKDSGRIRNKPKINKSEPKLSEKQEPEFQTEEKQDIEILPLEILPVENQGQINTYNKNTYDEITYNQSVNRNHEKNENSERQTDRKFNFSEILRLMDLSPEDFNFSETIEESALREKDFHDFCEEERFLSLCTLSYDLAFNKSAMTEALKFVFAYSYYSQNMTDENKGFFETVIRSISEMVSQKTFTFTCQNQKQSVEYSEIIDRLNEIMHSSRTSLIDWFFSFEQEWKKILSENEIKYQKAYMKTCIWNWLNDFLIVEDNQLMKLDYSLNWQVNTTLDKTETESNSDCPYNDNELIPDCSENKEWEDYLKTADELEAETNSISESELYESNVQANKIDRQLSDNIIRDIFVPLARQNNRPLRQYLPDYQYPLPDGLTLDYPFDKFLKQGQKNNAEAQYSQCITIT